MAANKPNPIPESVWRAILKEAAQGTSYAELARKWGPRVKEKYGRGLNAAQISRAAKREQQPGKMSPDVARILELGEKFREGLTEEDWNSIPHDGAEFHDHYLYGVPKHSR